MAIDLKCHLDQFFTKLNDRCWQNTKKQCTYANEQGHWDGMLTTFNNFWIYNAIYLKVRIQLIDLLQCSFMFVLNINLNEPTKCSSSSLVFSLHFNSPASILVSTLPILTSHNQILLLQYSIYSRAILFCNVYEFVLSNAKKNGICLSFLKFVFSIHNLFHALKSHNCSIHIVAQVIFNAFSYCIWALLYVRMYVVRKIVHLNMKGHNKWRIICEFYTFEKSIVQCSVLF